MIGLLRTTSPTDVADQLRVPATSISRHVARLTDAGLVRRSPNPSDGRSAILELTDEGRQKVATIAPRFRGIVDELRTHVAVEQIELALLDLERAAKALDLDRASTER